MTNFIYQHSEYEKTFRQDEVKYFCPSYSGAWIKKPNKIEY